MKKLLLALALWLSPFAAFAQCTGVFPANTLCGSVPGGVPGPVSTSVLTGVPGGSSGQTQYNNSGNFGGYTPSGDVAVVPSTGVETIQPGAVTGSKIASATVANSNLISGGANTTKGSLTGSAEVDLSMVTCSAVYQLSQWVTGTGWQCGINPVLPSRTIAASLNLSAFTAITTQGYTTPGDGGGATFKKLAGGVQFQDTFITGLPSITTAGSGLVNGTYLGVAIGGGSGAGCSGSAVVSGNVLASIAISVPCVGFKVSDVLTIVTAFIGGAGVAPTLTVNTVSTAQASFTDTSSNNWQYVSNGRANVLQFGCKPDWVGTDAGATNNSACFWSALAWASFPNSSGLAQVTGDAVFVPKGAYMTCGAWNSTIYDIPIPQGVRFSGTGVGATTLVECATDSSANHYIELCDSEAKVGQYGCKVENMTIYLGQVTASTANIAAIYSNSGQQFTLGEHLEIQPGARNCVKYEIGKGGAANDIWSNIDCELLANTTNAGFYLNSSSTQHYILHSVIGCVSGCSLAINHLAGRLIVDGLDVEAFVTGLQQNVTVAGNQSVYRNVQQNSNNCTQAISLITGNIAGNILFENVQTGCPKVILNGQSGGTDYNSTIRGPLMCVSAGACTAAIP